MKNILVIAAATAITAMSVNSASAQYGGQAQQYKRIRHERTDMYGDRIRLERLNRERRAAAYYGDERAYSGEGRQEKRLERDIRHDRHEIRKERRGRG